MDKGERNCIAVCGAGMLEHLKQSGHNAFDDFANCVLVAGWIPPEDRRVFLIDAEKWDALMETAEVWEKNDG